MLSNFSTARLCILLWPGNYFRMFQVLVCTACRCFGVPQGQHFACWSIKRDPTHWLTCNKSITKVWQLHDEFQCTSFLYRSGRMISDLRNDVVTQYLLQVRFEQSCMTVCSKLNELAAVDVLRSLTILTVNLLLNIYEFCLGFTWAVSDVW